MRKRQSGFTILELMVAITISMIAMVAASEVYVVSKSAARLQGMQSRLIEDGRFATQMIHRMLSQAGFRVNPAAAPDVNRLSLAGQALTVGFETDGVSQMICDGTVPATGSTQKLIIKKTTTALQCDAVDWIAPATSGRGNGTEVMDFQVTLGIDTGPSTPSSFGCGLDAGGTKPRDCIADTYVTALGTGQTNDQIVAVKFCLVLRTEETDRAIIKPADVNNCSGVSIANSQGDGRLYRTFSSTALLKNR